MPAFEWHSAKDVAFAVWMCLVVLTMVVLLIRDVLHRNVNWAMALLVIFAVASGGLYVTNALADAFTRPTEQSAVTTPNDRLHTILDTYRHQDFRPGRPIAGQA